MKDGTVENLKKNCLAYPSELGSPAFGEVTVSSERDLALRGAQERARREMDRLRRIADIVAEQAMETKRHAEMADRVSRAECNFSPKVGRPYWLVELDEERRTILCHLGPEDWAAGPPDGYRYVGKVQQLPTGLWESLQS